MEEMKRPEKLLTIREHQQSPPQPQPQSAAETCTSIPVLNISSTSTMASSSSGGGNTNRHSDNLFIWSHISGGLLATWLNGGGEFGDNRKLLIIDSRESNEFHRLHIKTAINIPDSNIVRQQLKSDKISINELLLKYSENRVDLGLIESIVVYDLQSEHTNQLDADHSFACILLRRLATKYQSVSFLSGGLVEFREQHANLCETTTPSSSLSPSSSVVVPIVVVHEKDATTDHHHHKMLLGGSEQAPSWLSALKPKRLFSHSLSTFGLNLNAAAAAASTELADRSIMSSSSSSSSATSSLSSFNHSSNMGTASTVTVNDSGTDMISSSTVNKGPTEILGFLYLGSQDDSLCEQTLKSLNITNILNVSATCPKPPFIDDAHFLRIAINDGHGEKILPYFDVAYRFIEKCRRANAKVLIHCLAGISRSPTLAIAYLMRHMGMRSDDAYKFVKERRRTISPNFNFLGQLYEYEKHYLNNNNALGTSGVDMTSKSNDETTIDLAETETTATTANMDESPSSSQPSVKLAKKMPILLSDSGNAGDSASESDQNMNSKQLQPQQHQQQQQQQRRKRQFIFRFNTASPFASALAGPAADSSSSLSSSSSTLQATSSASSLAYASLLSPSQALSSFNLNSPTEPPNQSSTVSQSSCSSMCKSKTMETIAGTVVLRRPTYLQTATSSTNAAAATSGCHNHSEKYHSLATSTLVQRPSAMASIHLLKRPSSILIGCPSTSQSTTTSSTASATMSMNSPSGRPQQLMCSSKEVQYNRTYSNTSAGSSSSTSCSSCSNMSSPGAASSGGSSSSSSYCTNCLPTSTQQPQQQQTSTSTLTIAQKKLKLSSMPPPTSLSSHQRNNLVTDSGAASATVDSTAILVDENNDVAAALVLAKKSNSAATTPTTPLTPNSTTLNVAACFAAASTASAATASVQSGTSTPPLSSWKTQSSKENLEDAALTTSISLNAINQHTQSTTTNTTNKSSSSSSSSKNSLCETMIEVS